MKFWIRVTLGYETFSYYVEYKPVDDITESFVVQTKDGNCTFASNRPYLSRNPALKKRTPAIMLVQGEMWNMALREKIAEAINAYMAKVAAKAK